MQKNKFVQSVHSSDIVDFRVPSPDWPHPFLNMLIQMTFSLKFLPACKKSVNSICSFLRYSQF